MSDGRRVFYILKGRMSIDEGFHTLTPGISFEDLQPYIDRHDKTWRHLELIVGHTNDIGSLRTVQSFVIK